MDSENPQQLGYGLLRFRSASSYLLGGFAETGPGKVSLGAEGLEAEKFGSRFMGFSGADVFEEKPKQSPGISPRGYSGLPPQYPRPSSGLSSSPLEGAYTGVGPMGVDHQSQPKLNSSNLARQSSSPAGLFSQVSNQNGYASVKGMGNYRMGSGFDGELSPPTNRSKGPFSFPSSLGMLSQISEIGSESLGEGGPDDSSRIGIGNSEGRFLGSGFHFNSWNDSSHFSDNFTSLKRERDNDIKLFPGSQNNELGSRGPLLSRHLSLQRSSSEMSTMEKLLQFQDSVPCKIRAKRGCATHPRSIAERVRRTRISERMRKLQELVPNMDKQTNTADMLDLAVGYIKDLQKQFKTLSAIRANCKCLNMQNSVANKII
ncbi:transcription factor bHLH130-like [Punica granatum]|uniref:Uncharacterized protein n=2 Tax=Punica granatum TaxID=22663 RepID=A0A2I0KV47_PUNGR|nr:transcription factor bHLH130-like [Punica granatum]PKI72200.1 hypothetical protein CRG98_007398 [Punica granatum]